MPISAAPSPVSAAPLGVATDRRQRLRQHCHRRQRLCQRPRRRHPWICVLAPQARPDDRAWGPTDFRADLRHGAERSLHLRGAAIITVPRRRIHNARDDSRTVASKAPIVAAQSPRRLPYLRRRLPSSQSQSPRRLPCSGSMANPCLTNIISTSSSTDTMHTSRRSMKYKSEAKSSQVKSSTYEVRGMKT